MAIGIFKFLGFLRKKLRRRRVAAVDIVAAEDESKGMQSKMLFCWEEIMKFTMNFSVVIGNGGFSTVYLARFPDSSMAAVKIQCCSSERLNLAYRQELEVLLNLQHPNIVKLLGHCDDREEGMLILEYVPNGNLHENLHGKPKMGLSWKARLAMAFQLAQAIEYLHNTWNTIHGDIKSSNILLDEQLNCKLCDFGSAKKGFSSLVTARPNRRLMQGSPGYADPHYLRTGLASKKNDVYSFGVVMLELITGREALDPLTGERLTAMVRDGCDRAVEVVDPRLGGFHLEEARAAAALAAMCVCDCPTRRPSPSDIVAIMTDKIPWLQGREDLKFF